MSVIVEKALRRRPKIQIADEDLGGRTQYYRDYTAVLHSPAFRRLRHKTQVFSLPENDLICTRMEHVLIVSSVSSVICRKLKIDQDLAIAIAIGHDLGHPPFGHAGEEQLDSLAKDAGGFHHEEFSLRIVDELERPPKGLNLTYAVRDGILHHSGESELNDLTPRDSAYSEDELKGFDIDVLPCTLQGCVVRLADKIAYLGRDIEDGITAGLVSVDDVPADLHHILGEKNGEIIDYFVKDAIENSTAEPPRARLSDDTSGMMNRLMDFNYKNIYHHDRLVLAQKLASTTLSLLFDVFVELHKDYGFESIRYRRDSRQPVRLFGEFVKSHYSLSEKDDSASLSTRLVVDFLATLTDQRACEFVTNFFVPKPLV